MKLLDLKIRTEEIFTLDCTMYVYISEKNFTKLLKTISEPKKLRSRVSFGIQNEVEGLSFYIKDYFSRTCSTNFSADSSVKKNITFVKMNCATQKIHTFNNYHFYSAAQIFCFSDLISNYGFSFLECIQLVTFDINNRLILGGKEKLFNFLMRAEQIGA